MNTKPQLLIKFFLLISILSSSALYAKEWKGQWTAQNGKTFTYHIKVKDGQKASPVAFYLTHLKIKRIGTVADQTILADLQDRGFMTVELNCSVIAGTSPQMENELADFATEMPKLLLNTIEDNKLVEPRSIYYLPEGYNIAYDQPYWDRLKHGAFGTAERIVEVYNKYVVPKYKVPEAKTVEEIKGKKGQPLDHSLRMDIIYPAGKLDSGVPLAVIFASQAYRMKTYYDTPKRIEYPLGFLLSGYAWAIVDHDYVTVAKDQYYGFIKGKYSLDNWNGLASSSAAIRYLRANAAKYNLNDKIGAMGISKASYAVTRLADTQHDKLTELLRFEGFKKGSPQPQPYQGVSSNISVGYTAAGDGTERVQYFTKNTVPLVSSAGKTDKFKKWDAFPKLLARYEEMDINYLGLWMEDMGHSYPEGKDFATGQDRYLLLKRFFDSHLQPQKELQVLYILPCNGNEQVMTNGHSLSISQSVESPPDMRGLSMYSPITVRFATSLPVGVALVKNMKIVNVKTQKAVEGEWKASLQNTRFEFTPKQDLQAKTEYTIIVMPGIRDKNGATLQKEVKSQFRTQ